MTKSFLTLCLTLSIASFSHAASVTKVKGTKALIDTSGLESVEVGAVFFALDGQGKRRALLKITQIKGSKALAEITKGRAEEGYELRAKAAASQPPAQTMSTESSEEDSNSSTTSHLSGQQMGVMLGLTQTSMTANFTAAATEISAAMSGMGFGVSSYYDYPLFAGLQFRGVAGYEQVNATGEISTPSCSESNTCDFKVSYLSLYGLGKYNFSESPSRFWVVAGAGFLIAMSKSSSVIKESQISTNQIYTAGFGYDFAIGRKSIVPVSLEYSMFPPSDTVSASIINVRVGYGWNM